VSTDRHGLHAPGERHRVRLRGQYAFDITPGTATSWSSRCSRRTRWPGAAISPAVLVSALDPRKHGAGLQGDVTVAFPGNNPGGSTLGGTTTVAAVNGVARFWDLTGQQTGTSYWLTATATGLKPGRRAASSVSRRDRDAGWCSASSRGRSQGERFSIRR